MFWVLTQRMVISLNKKKRIDNAANLTDETNANRTNNRAKWKYLTEHKDDFTEENTVHTD